MKIKESQTRFVRDGYGVFVWDNNPVSIASKESPEFYTRYFPTEQDAREFAMLEQLAGKSVQLVVDIPLVRK